MTLSFKLLVAALLFCAAVGAVAGESEFTQYLGHQVTVNACNQTIYTGTMVAEWPTTIVVREECTPMIGNVTLRKSCIIWIREGYDCVGAEK